MSSSRPDPPRRSRYQDLRGAALMSVIGITLVVSSSIGVGIGFWIDGRWHTDPWGKVIGFLFGTAAGFLEMFRALKEANDDD